MQLLSARKFESWNPDSLKISKVCLLVHENMCSDLMQKCICQLTKQLALSKPKQKACT